MENISNNRENLNEFLEEAELQQYYELFRDILKVSKVSQLKFVVTEDLVQIGLSKPEQRRYKKVYSKHFPNPYLTKIKRLLSTKKPDINPHGSSYPMPLEIQPPPGITVKGATKHIICIEDITINKELGMGQFGVVQQGTWATENQRLQVAIKCLGQERMTSNSTEFLKEAAVMHSIEHPSIVRLYGVVLHMDSLMLVTELAPLRSLLECLREVSLRSNFPVPNLCQFAEQICDGMTYLENKRLIHRDLAARNILVFSKDRVKISDFGLSRALGVGKDYYQTNYNVNLKLPVAWCAPECILYLRFTSSSDVWAFGVCLWEMFTYGFQPWAAFSGQQILEAIDTPNFQRLERPECCPEAYYTTMLECWSHEPTARPKFKDLKLKLREINPEQVQATTDFLRPEEGRRTNMLEYKAGQVMTVLGKEGMTKSSLWYGEIAGGACGMFDSNQTKPYVNVDKGTPLASISPHPTRQSSRTIRSSLLRSDVKRHTYTGKRTIQRSMISNPQGDVKHTGHVGLDGAYFGDISFLDTAGQLPRQIVTPYKPSEDVEQQPLINPNSPSHLFGATGSPYPLLATTSDPKNCDEVDLAYSDTKTKSQKKQSHKSVSEPTTSKRILNKVKSATLGRSHRTDENAASKIDEVHEYHEISDTDTESNAADNTRTENFINPDSPRFPKSYGDFGQSLLDEMESMFRNLDGSRRRDEASGSGKHANGENFRSNTLSKADKKKQSHHTGTMKPMSAHEEKTLATAVAMANEITTKSMNDLDGKPKVPSSPNDRYRFHFKFPQLSLQHNSSHEPAKEASGRHERRNFTEEANSVLDIQSTITEESKHAYSSLIEQPKCSNLRRHMGPRGTAATMPKPSLRADEVTRIRSRETHYWYHISSTISELDDQAPTSGVNELPLPPRNTKPKLVDKPRHYRKYPLKLPYKPALQPPVVPNIYQNACPQVPNALRAVSPVPSTSEVPSKPKVPTKSPTNSITTNGVDVCDGKDTGVDTNPFKSGSSAVNPFDCFEDAIVCDLTFYYDNDARNRDKVERLVRDCSDHVSVEDLLEFADQKPCGRQRGVESDEVRIMSKVLKEQVTPEDCLQALELSDWNVHKAIKVVRVKLAVEADISLHQCSGELERAAGDIVKASAAIIKK